MIGYFPIPFPDEMMYSLIARYHLVSANVRESYTKEELFSKKYAHIRNDFFQYALELEERLKHFTFYDAKEIIKHFTFYEYYRKFLNKNDTKKLESLILENRTGNISGYIFSHEIEKSNNKFLKFCLECFEEESAENVPYWHNSHNLPGVTMCLKHNCILVESDVLWKEKKLKPLSSKICGNFPSFLDDWDLFLMKLINVEIIELFNSEESFSDYKTAYILYLYNLGYINSDIDEIKLKRDFGSFYSEKLCELLNIEKLQVISYIIADIMDSKKNYHPLFHILFIIFCGKKLKDLSNLMLPSPFGSPPFKCRNIACRYFNKKCITEYYLHFRHSGLFGTFKCTACGYCYILDSRNSGKSEVLQYGEVWWNYLIGLLYDKDFSVETVCQKLKIGSGFLYELLPTRLRDINFNNNKYSIEQYRESFLSEYERGKEPKELFQYDNLFKVRQWLRAFDYKWYDANE